MFIVFEGIDGSGKSSVISAVEQLLKTEGHSVQKTSEFGRSDSWSIEAREKLMAARNAQEELHVIMNTRCTHYLNVLAPALREDSIVLMDRYLMSTIAYQGSQTISPSWLIGNHDAQRLPMPDLVIYLDISMETSQQRRQHRPESNKIDQRPPEFFSESLLKYWSSMECLKPHGWRIECLNAELPLSSVIDSAARLIYELIQQADPLLETGS